MVRWCGLPAMPTRFFTVDAEVKQTASKPPVLIMSRVSGAGGAARTVRYATTSSTSQPFSFRPSTSRSEPRSARGSSTRLTGSMSSTYSGKISTIPAAFCFVRCGTSSGNMPRARSASAVFCPTAPRWTPAKERASRPSCANFFHTAFTALTEVNRTHW